MLTEINCKLFLENKINFKKGLNTILGDNLSSNSIGKSTLLMIIDFVFGGDTYLQKNSGAIKELGHHTFLFAFQFNSTQYYYSRSTDSSETINICDRNYNVISEQKTDKYRQDLKLYYNLDINQLSFRSAVSTYSRVWGKENNNVDKPLQSFLKESESDSINNLIKLFELYDSISEKQSDIKLKKEQKNVINGIHKHNFISKINKTEYKKNLIELEEITNSINNIKKNLLNYTVNVEELTSKELIDLKLDKSQLLRALAEIQNKIERINLNLTQKSVKSKYFKKLSEFIPSTNEGKLDEIENFHNKISIILNRELLNSKDQLIEQASLFELQIDELNLKINELLKNIKSPTFIIDKLHDLTIQEEKINRINKYYQEKIDITEDIKELSSKLEISIEEIINSIETKINNELIIINELIHTKDKKVPYLILKTNSYKFNHSGDEGTGKSYSDLIEFDILILKLTKLPFIIHDSPFFKNIGDLVMENIISLYNQFDKQIFIAIDGINRYSAETQKVLINNNAVQLTDTKQLFIKDWRIK
ncbi:MAG: hypothetical protein RLZZ540_2883 [Bacteroidota bacterium]|jgi:hypothetical protein